MASYLEIDLFNSPFLTKLKERITISKTLSTKEKSELKNKISEPIFLKLLQHKLNKNIFDDADIAPAMQFLLNEENK